jgi:transposase
MDGKAIVPRALGRKEPRMSEYISFDSHRKYTLAEREEALTGHVVQKRIEHWPGAFIGYLKQCPGDTPVALEATGNWYWIVREIELSGHRALLVHPRKAKLMMGMINKTDKLDVHGLNRLQRNGTLPTVWIPPGELRDLRELTRTRMVLSTHRTRLKNRLSSTLAKYGRRVVGFKDMFAAGARAELESQVQQLPEQTRWGCRMLLEQLDLTQRQIDEQEKRLEDLLRRTPEMEWLDTLPGVGLVLSAVIALEVGDVGRFATAERLASYAGTTPRVHSSGGKTRYGGLRPDVNRYLKWAFIEAANCAALQREKHPERHVTVLYERLRPHKGHPKAIGAVARHLAESAYYVMSRREDYKDPALGRTRKG